MSEPPARWSQARRHGLWVGATILALVVVLSGWLPRERADDVLARVLPVLVFLALLTLLSELLAVSGLFDLVAAAAARVAGGRVPLLFGMVCLVAIAVTVTLGLDTTAVLLTPVVLVLARRLDLDPVPFALGTVVLANTASLLLPVSNLTNLIARERTGVSVATFVGATWAPAVATAAVSTLVLWLLLHRRLRGPAAPMPAVQLDDPPLTTTAAVVTVGFLVLVLFDAPLWAAAGGCVAVLAAVTLRRVPGSWRALQVPWRTLVVLLALFLVADAVVIHGLGDVLVTVAGASGDGAGELARLAGSGAVLANAINNLPAYLALEPAAGSLTRTVALLVGVNAGPLVLVWASVATVLWRDRCRAAGVHVGAATLALVGAAVAVPTVAAGVAALILVT